MLSKWRLVLSGLLPGGGIMLVGFACIAMARWSRSRGANALVLLQREEALRAEQERQKVLAANLERNRISATMQTEVLTTLESVIAQADEGLVMLNAEPAPDSMQIAAAFAAIGARGRAALAHMRQLLKTKLVDMDLSVRALNCLKAAEVETLGELCRFNKNDLLKFRNFGKKSLTELEALLENNNLEFGMDVTKYKLDKE